MIHTVFFYIYSLTNRLFFENNALFVCLYFYNSFKITLFLSYYTFTIQSLDMLSFRFTADSLLF